MRRTDMKITKLIAALERVKAKHGNNVDVLVPEIVSPASVAANDGVPFAKKTRVLVTKTNTILLLGKSSIGIYWQGKAEAAAAGK
jgi:hypothetical protein